MLFQCPTDRLIANKEGLKLWPSHFDPFDEDDPVSWFSRKNNLTFGSWNLAIGSRRGDWKSLEDCIQIITDVDDLQWSELSNQAASTVLFENVGQNRKPGSARKQKEIGKQLGSLLIEVSMVEWKNSMKAWVMQACIALAPRTAHFAKLNVEKARKAIARGKKDESQYDSSDTDDDLPASPKVASQQTQVSNTAAEPPAPKKTRLIDAVENNVLVQANNDEYANPSKRRTPTPSTASMMQSGVLPSNFLFVQRTLSSSSWMKKQATQHHRGSPWLYLPLYRINS